MCESNPVTVGFRSKYGADETNGLVDGSAYHRSVDYSRTLSLREVSDLGGKITRVRLLTEGNRCDVSYIHASLPDGTIVNVYNGIDNLTPRRMLKASMIAWAKREGVYAKGIDLLNDGNWSVL